MTWLQDAALFAIAIGCVFYTLKHLLFALATMRDIKREQYELRRDLKAALSEIVKCRDSHALSQERFAEFKVSLAAHQDELDRLFDHTGARREIRRY